MKGTEKSNFKSRIIGPQLKGQQQEPELPHPVPLQAGRGLDMRVSEIVMGREVTHPPQSSEGYWLEWTGVPESSEGEARELPRYSTEIASAWEVVNKIIAQDGSGLDYGFTLDATHYGWQVTLISNDQELANGEGFFTATANTPAEAICLAALRAIGEVR